MVEEQDEPDSAGNAGNINNEHCSPEDLGKGLDFDGTFEVHSTAGAYECEGI